MTKAAEATSIVSPGFDALSERGVEAALSVANGYFGVRAALEEGNPASNPRLLVAGRYVPGDDPGGPMLLSLPDPAAISIEIDGLPLDLGGVRTWDHERWIDLLSAELCRTWRFQDAQDRVWLLSSQRAASADDAAIYLHQLALALERGCPAIVRIATPFAQGAAQAHTISDGVVRVVCELEAAAHTVLKCSRSIVARGLELADETVLARIAPGDTLSVETTASVIAPACIPEASVSFDAFRSRHRAAWRPRWEFADIEIQGDEVLQQGVRFAAYHLLSAAADTGGMTSISARNLSGEAYRGHIFWDAELFVLPALTLVWPEAARSSLMYRHRTMPAAKVKARRQGYEGALYAWESADTGEDVTPTAARDQSGHVIPILNGEQEHHISAAIPFAALRYWHATGDDSFMRDHGAELLIECARFWASRVSPTDGSYSIKRVIGPDEYHVGVDNNAYTNAMARHVLTEAANYVDGSLRSDTVLREHLEGNSGEAADWRRTASAIVRSSGFEANGVVEQFDGFHGLADVDVAAHRHAGLPLDIAVGGPGAVGSLRAVKQADVLMLACLLPDWWSYASLKTNFDYYEPITAHTSSLSPPMHALLAAWLRDEERCIAYLRESARIDLDNGYRNAAGGVHIGALGGLWQAVVFGLGGFQSDDRSVSFDPWLPRPIGSLGFNVWWRGRRLAAAIEAAGRIRVTNAGDPCDIRVNSQHTTVGRGETVSFAFSPSWTLWTQPGRDR